MKWNFLNHDRDLPIIDQLLENRQINDSIDKEQFLNPSLDHLNNPEMMDGMNIAKVRIEEAIENGESILVFGDYDADGVTATTLLVETLNELGAMCDYYIPNRFTEGYGPNPNAFKEAKQQGFDLIITVDTGIAAVESASTAKELGLDLIITDHHEPQEELPEALAIIHPKLSPEYPFNELAGVGVAFKLAHHLLGYFPHQFLDLVAIGTVADLVPLLGENRVLVHHGLQGLKTTKRQGLKALKEVIGIKDDVTEQDIGFGIGPRLNAVGRLQAAYPAVELLLTDDPSEAQKIASEIHLINQERQEIVTAITQEAETIIEANIEKMKRVIVVAKEGWNEGVLGIVASKLVRHYQRPVICLTIKPEDQKAKGSGRSIPAFDLFENGMEIKHLFLQFGGHAQAAGMSLEIDQIDAVRDSLNKLAKEKLSDDDYKEQLDIDATLSISSVDLNIVETIQKLAPFGMGNPKPIFHFKGTTKSVKQIGANKNHLKFDLITSKEEQGISSVAFGMGDLVKYLTPETPIDVSANLEINEWNGMKKSQLMIKDILIDDFQLFDFRGSKFWKSEFKELNDDNALFVRFQPSTTSELFSLIDADQLNEQPIQSKMVVLVDMPNDLSEISTLLNTIQPQNILACYSVGDDHFLNSFPTRDDFKWFYGFLMKRKRYSKDQDRKLIQQHKGWKEEKIEFIINVFYDLKFVTIFNGVVQPNQDVIKKDLTESNVYQNRLKEREVQEVLYYSNYNELKKWLKSQVEHSSSSEEEIAHGF